MSGDKELSLVPRLRFPEFQEKNGWEKHPLSEMLEEVLRPVVMKDDEDYSLVTVKRRYGGIVLRDVLKGRDILVKSQFRIKKNDFLISKRQIVHCACGVVPEEHDDAIVSNEYTILRAKENCDICFFNYFVQQHIVGRSFLECSVGIVIEKMLFKQDQWLKKKFFFPTLPEQQKIADCLSSLDDLLTAEVQKLDALKKYKKSLLQQLFPRQGEKVPRLRFPEFEKSEAWVEKELHQLGELISGLTYSPNDVCENGLLVLRSSNIQNGRIVLEDNVYVREDINGANLSLENDILICVRNGSKKLIGKNALIPKGMPLCTHGAFMTVFRSDFAKFVIQLFQTDVYEKQVAADLGATINSINSNHLKKYKFFVPKLQEQEKIANCLSYIDNLLEAQHDKIKKLKDHRNGLLQHLFPTDWEVPS